MRIFITGLNGSGKTTHAKWLAKTLGWHYFSVGDFVRNNTNDEIGEFLKQGRLAPCEAAIRNRVMSLPLYAIVDGFPRSQDQLDWLSHTRREKQDIIIGLGVSRNIAYQRLISRGRESQETVAKLAYATSLNFMDSSSIMTINSERAEEEVREDIKRHIEEELGIDI